MTEFKFDKIDETVIKAKVIDCYGFNDNTDVKLLKYSENLTYLIEDSDHKKSVLRVFRPNYHDMDEMLSEITWIHQLKENTDVHTADIICGINSEYICGFEFEGMKYNCALFEFMNGENLKDLSEEQIIQYIELIGEVAAKLHIYSSKWKDASNLKRFSWDINDMVGPYSRWGDYSNMKELPEEWMKTYEMAVTIAKKKLESYGRNSDRYGLVHADLNIYNVLVEEKDDKKILNILDFDDCGFSWFMYDLSVSLLEYFGDMLDKCKQSLLKGYTKYRKLTDVDLEILDTCIVIRKIVRIGWIAGHSNNDTVKRIDKSYFEDTYLISKEFVEKNIALGN